MAVRNECACGKELGTGPPCPMGHTKAPGRRVPGSVSTGTTRPNTSLWTGEPRAAGPRAWLGACVTPRPPGALGDRSGQHAPLSQRGLVPFALFQLAFGQGAGRVDHGGQEDGEARRGCCRPGLPRPPVTSGRTRPWLKATAFDCGPSPDSSLCLLSLSGPWVLHQPACGLSHTLRTVPWLTTALDGPA